MQDYQSQTQPRWCKRELNAKFVLTLFGLAMASASTTAHAQVFDSPFELSDLATGDGTRGVSINGVAPGDRSGNSVSAAGDVNGDGIDDVIIGNLGQIEPTRPSAGYVVFGSNAGIAPGIELSSLDGTNGFAINTNEPNYSRNNSVSGAGDINDDGLDDIIIAIPDARVSDQNIGAAYVIFGNDQGFPAQINLSTLDGSDGFRISSSGSLRQLSVSGAGDVNGDGIDDCIISAPFARAGGGPFLNGASYVLFGSNQGFSRGLDLSELDGTNGFAINGVARAQYSGSSVSAAGDVNADGLDDVIIGAKFARPNGEYSGASFVIFGSSTGFPAAISLGELDGSTGFEINGTFAGEQAGISVSGAGDVNGDDLDDVIIGASVNSGSNSGSGYVVFGSSQGFPATIELADLDGRDGFRIKGVAAEDYAGEVVSGAGDINGDGLNDLLIGAPNSNRSNNYPGAGFVVFGSSQGFPAVFELSMLNGTRGFAINGAGEYNFAGRGISAAGDFNGDDVDDLIVGARSASPGGRAAAGASYVIFGKSDTENPQVSLSIEDNSVREEQSGATVTLRLNRASREEVTATVNTRPGSAINGEDFYGWTKTARFAPGVLTSELALTIIDDASREPEETFLVRIADASGATISDDIARVTIIDNDSEPVTPLVSVLDGRVTEGRQHNIELKLSEPTNREVSVELATKPDSALNGRDFYGLYTVVRFAAGETSASVAVQTLPDTEIEGEERFLVQIFNSTGADIGDASASISIFDSDR